MAYPQTENLWAYQIKKRNLNRTFADKPVTYSVVSVLAQLKV